MKTILTLALVLISSLSFSQEKITTSQAKENLGKEVILIGEVASIKLASEGRTTNYINV